MTESPRLRLAMPIAHVTGTPYYGPYYFGTDCVFQVTRYFDQNGCEGLELERNPASPFTLSEDIWDFYAVADGFLSLNKGVLILRLPRELFKLGRSDYNSGRLFYNLDPKGPQLQYITYKYSFNDISVSIGDKISEILIQRILDRLAISDLERRALSQLKGKISVFAGQKLGNFKDCKIELSFLDSCGHIIEGHTSGRPINPAYFFYILRSSRNKEKVHWMTALPENQSPSTTPPLDFLLRTPRMESAPDLHTATLDLNRQYPPPPLHITVAKGETTTLLPMGLLGKWHQSRNSAKSDTESPLEWRLYGDMEGDNDISRIGEFLTSPKPWKAKYLPKGDNFDYRFKPDKNQENVANACWMRYYPIFNVIARTFQIPVELLVSISCTETGHLMIKSEGRLNKIMDVSVVRIEPINIDLNKYSTSGSDKELISQLKYLQEKVGSEGANAYIPEKIDLNAKVRIESKNRKSEMVLLITWKDLDILTKKFRDIVRISPGIMQTLITTFNEDLKWAKSMYGDDFINHISCEITIDGNIEVLRPIYKDDSENGVLINWFGISDAANSVDRTRMLRALHGIIAGAIHIKRRYNTVETTKDKDGKPKLFNMIVDFDPPTTFSAYNDGANTLKRDEKANPDSDDEVKYISLFHIKFFDWHYPSAAPRYYNAAVKLFNSNDQSIARPSVRIWRGKR